MNIGIESVAGCRLDLPIEIVGIVVFQGGGMQVLVDSVRLEAAAKAAAGSPAAAGLGVAVDPLAGVAAEKLVAERHAARLTQAQAARRAGISRSLLSGIETGKLVPGADRVLALRRVYLEAKAAARRGRRRR